MMLTPHPVLAARAAVRPPVPLAQIRGRRVARHRVCAVATQAKGVGFHRVKPLGALGALVSGFACARMNKGYGETMTAFLHVGAVLRPQRP